MPVRATSVGWTTLSQYVNSSKSLVDSDMNCSAMPSTNASSSGRGTWVPANRWIRSGSSDTTNPSPATTAPSLLSLVTWYAAVASKASRSSQDSQCSLTPLG